MNRELPDVQAGFRKGRGTRDLIGNIRWIIEKSKGIPKNICFCFTDYSKAFESVATHLQPDILESEVNWTFGSITTDKASGGDGIPTELFEILKDDADKVLSSAK